ncbi:Phosphoheptose isomerase 1 [Paramagnetospirillum magnetotacticum MS-1]|uniref:Phosphoheptose isomerase 1 n=1 Tax=Paramagnetospirillum magnetotacticum MS-1 TaxID=272627 RepID=A0A0C2YRQ5_PARME|nr:SIS domain-containing protein [Paramagnetospirillum magnetotacticum]KIL97813.1 Phosphoheptose isomerase 1 [Paramagnetospirillum magnetotacticum MS-1]
MSFPDKPFGSITTYFEAYAEQVGKAMASVPRSALAAAEILLREAVEADAHVYCCGNGGSAAISNHLVCDHVKGIQTDTDFKPRVHSLSSTIEMITAIANDISYAEVFCYQLQSFARPGDLLITISSSGDSENVVRAIQWAKDNGVRTLAMTGFSGGRSSRLADVSLHVTSDNYGVIEDVHQSLMHVLAQFVRMGRMSRDLITARKF